MHYLFNLPSLEVGSLQRSPWGLGREREREREREIDGGEDGRQGKERNGGMGCLNKHITTVEFAGSATWSNPAHDSIQIFFGIFCV
jgi:hypothetical protein